MQLLILSPSRQIPNHTQNYKPVVESFLISNGEWSTCPNRTPSLSVRQGDLVWNSLTVFIFLDSKITADGDWSHEIKRHLLLGRKAVTNLDSIWKNRDITLPTKVHLVKAMVFPVVVYGCESWTIKKAECQRIDAFELWCWRRFLRVPWTAVNPKGNQTSIFIGRTDAETKASILRPPGVKNWLTGKDPDAGKDWRQEKGTTEDEMVGWHHWLNGHEFQQAPEVGDGQGSLVCCSPRGCKELDRTERLNWIVSICQLQPSLSWAPGRILLFVR